MVHVQRLVIVLLGVPLTSCAGLLAGPTGDQALATWRAEAAEIEARLDRLQVVDGTWSRGDGEGTFRAWFEDDELIVVHERLRFGDYGRRTGRLYYQDGALRYYVAEGTGIENDGEGRRQQTQVRREIVFDPAGREIAGRQETGGAVGPIEADVVVGVRLHGAELKREAERLRLQ